MKNTTILLNNYIICRNVNKLEDYLKTHLKNNYYDLEAWLEAITYDCLTCLASGSSKKIYNYEIKSYDTKSGKLETITYEQFTLYNEELEEYIHVFEF